MAYLPESSTFDPGVYQLETTDPVVGGANGASNAPLKNLTNRTKYLKDHVDAIEAAYAPKASPAFTGTPTVPTATTGTNTTQAASTAFVQAAVAGITSGASVGNVTPVMDGTAAVGTATTAARSDHVHPTDTTRAPLASPAFTGTPTAPTAALGTNNTGIATNALVHSARGSYKESPIITGAFALSAGHAGMAITCGGAGGYSVSLPDYTTFTTAGYSASSGLTFTLVITSPNITITLANTANAFIYYNSGAIAVGTSFSVTTGDTIVIAPVNGAWEVISGIPASQIKGNSLGSAWSNVTASRAFNTTYTNTSAFIRAVQIDFQGNANQYGYAAVTVDSQVFQSSGSSYAGYGVYMFIQVLVPPGKTYKLSTLNQCSIVAWRELI